MVTVDKFTDYLEDHALKKLKHGHTKPGDCISTDHYMPVVPDCLPHAYGRDKAGCTCGTLFVDHASGKIFNFSQMSTTAAKIVQSKLHLTACALPRGLQHQSLPFRHWYLCNQDFQIRLQSSATNLYFQWCWCSSLEWSC